VEAASETEDAAVRFTLNATQEVNYAVTDPTSYSDEEIGVFGVTSALLTVYPYLRELVQSTSLRCGLAPIVLDLVRIPMGAREEGAAMEPMKP
jgi:preprotein translocase subunit SecB